MYIIPITWKYSVESHIILWFLGERWEHFPILCNIGGNTHIFPTLGSAEIFPVNPYNSQNMVKENSHRIKKNMRKCKYFKIQAFLNILCKTEIHAIPKVWDAVNSYSTEKLWEKNKHSKTRYSWIFHVKQKSMQFPNHGMNEFLYNGTSMERHRHFPDCALPHRSKVSGNPSKPQCMWIRSNSHNIEIFCEKPYHSQDVRFWGN